MLPLESVRSLNKDLLQCFQESFVLVSRANRDPEPTRDRVTIVIADKDPLLAQRVHDSSRDVARGGLDEDEVGFRRRVFEPKLVQLQLQPATLGNDVVDDLAVVLL